ncbi:DUF2062 domain-containing protein [uncultured Victivallis sp.]|uniref:DUF2062 domain-containing protein n=1 Tax=uncultured Victivallis sp. TaxID=354118 RepID=UPI0025FDEC0C|nr:DUF2062 domain-containing protein [uncultured Victivallis sp.]
MSGKRRGTAEKLRRRLRFYYLKIMRNNGSPEYIARGVAVGIFIGFFLPIGFQSLPAIALAWLLKGAKIPAFLLTFHSNYVTSFFFYPVQCYVGSWLLFHPLRWRMLTEQLHSLVNEPSLKAFFELGTPLVLSFFAGGLFFGLLTAIPGYRLTVRLVLRFRAERAKRRAKATGKKL